MTFETAVRQADSVFVNAPDESAVAVSKTEARLWHKNRLRDGKRPSWELYNGHVLFIGLSA